MNMVSMAMYESRRATVERATDLKESAEFHRKIYRLIRAGKSEEARAAMNEHLDLAQRAFETEEVSIVAPSKRDRPSRALRQKPPKRSARAT
jgi:GntR family transcriptional repressor for pyruvate dehydrogenase complex